MNNGKNIFDYLTSTLNALILEMLHKVFGPGVDQNVIGSLTWADLLTAACFILPAVVISSATAVLLKRKARQSPSGNAEELRRRLMHALGRPLCLVIWIFGIYLAATPLLLKLPRDGTFKAAGASVDQVLVLSLLVVLFWLGYRFTHVLEARLTAWAARSKSKFDNLAVPLLGQSLRVVVPVVGVILALPVLNLPAEYAGLLAKATGTLLIVAVALILFKAVNLGEKAVLARFDITVADNLHARKIYTQVHVIGKLVYFVISLFAVASILMLFEEVRRFGTSILASAGVIGIILGFAAQKTIANLFAGFQLAMAQPIRLDDVVIVENEWGRIEEITLTYVVIRLWDERRLVVPLSYFIEKPFQNWTRVSADLLGAVTIWVDYSLPLEETRTALKQIIEKHPLWDKRFWNLQVTDANEHAMQIRVLATAADSARAFDLRCAIREQLIGYIQKNHPLSLPQRRNLQFDGEKVAPPKP